jgi:pimeloyl-ACP methyl ester carboxylesterase
MKIFWITLLLSMLPLVCGLAVAVGGEPPPGNPQPVHELATWRVRLATGIDLHYVTPASPDSPAHRASTDWDIDRAVILVHGYSDSWRSFEEVLPRLAQAGLSMPIYAVDLRGHGASSQAASGSYTQSDFAADLAALMDALRIRQAVLIGHSLGSNIAHKFALEHPDRTAALVLIGSTPTYAEHPVVLSLAEAVYTFEDEAPAPLDFVIDFQTSALSPTTPPAVLYRYIAASLQMPGRVWKAIMDGMLEEDHSVRLTDLVAPTLIIAGDQDPFFGPPEQHALDTLIPYSTLMLYPEAGHTVQVEQPEAVVETIRTFLHQTFPDQSNGSSHPSPHRG